MLPNDFIELQFLVKGEDFIESQEVDATVGQLVHTDINVDGKPEESHVILGQYRF